MSIDSFCFYLWFAEFIYTKPLLIRFCKIGFKILCSRYTDPKF